MTQDLARRDFTVNAMAVDTADGTLLDPHGGRDDLAAGVLRTPLDPEVSFGDDPLRMLRAARFVASHGLRPAAELVAAVRNMGDRLEIVAAERIRDELEKLLLLDDPTAGFRFLFDTGLVDRVLADLSRQDPDQLGRVVAAVAAQPAARWAALFVSHPPGSVDARLRKLRCSGSLAAQAAALSKARAALWESAGGPPDVRRVVHDCLVGADEALSFATAVAAARGEPLAALHAFAATLADLRRSEDVDNPRLPLDGAAVMAALDIEPGPEVGEALEHLRELAFEHGPMDAAEAVAALQRWQDNHYCREL